MTTYSQETPTATDFTQQFNFLLTEAGEILIDESEHPIQLEQPNFSTESPTATSFSGETASNTSFSQETPTATVFSQEVPN